MLMKNSKFQQRLKNMDYLIKMKLSKTIDIKESYKNALDFINKIKEKIPVIEYKINNPII